MPRLAALVVCSLLAACVTKHNPAASCPDGTCSDPAFPYCDADGAITGNPMSCIAVTCTPQAFATCDGSAALTCNAAGSGYDSTACADGCTAGLGCNECAPSTDSCGSGAVNHCGSDGRLAGSDVCALDCVDAPAPHCAYLQPIYLPNVCDTPAAQASLMITDAGVFDPNFDVNCTGGIVTQTGAPDICVVHYGTISITTTATLSVASSGGQPGRVIAFIADGDVNVDGVLDVSAHGSFNGPGGGAIVSGGGPSASGNGGGGAGGQTPGGAGGNSTSQGGAANGGGTAINPALLTGLVGGAAAYQLVDSAMTYQGGGGGGGGAMLVSCTGTISVSGTIDVSGGGGAGGVSPFFETGFGGGAGGNVVLQGPHIVVTGQVFSNGGGGGGGMQATGVSGITGSDGTRSETIAAAGGLSQNGDGQGGSGGIGITNPGPGGAPTNASAKSGGGGGSVGFLQTYTPVGVSPTLTPTFASPAFQPNGAVQTR